MGKIESWICQIAGLREAFNTDFDQTKSKTRTASSNALNKGGEISRTGTVL